MDDYSQPDFYRFNKDSLELVNFIVNRGLTAHSILDLGAGSGVIGIELARKLKAKQLTLLELQNDYEIHLQKNAEFFLDDDIHCNIELTSFGEYEPHQKFNLIVCNPPYYLPGAGEVPKDQRRALARTFLKDSWSILIKKISECLMDDGVAFIVLKADQKLVSEISKQALACGLNVTTHQKDELFILEIFTLNID